MLFGQTPSCNKSLSIQINSQEVLIPNNHNRYIPIKGFHTLHQAYKYNFQGNIFIWFLLTSTKESLNASSSLNAKTLDIQLIHANLEEYRELKWQKIFISMKVMIWNLVISLKLFLGLPKYYPLKNHGLWSWLEPPRNYYIS